MNTLFEVGMSDYETVAVEISSIAVELGVAEECSAVIDAHQKELIAIANELVNILANAFDRKMTGIL